jgi:hypothetical protein
MLYIGKMDAETTTVAVEQEMKKLYKEKEVNITVVQQQKPDRFGDISFAIKVVSKGEGNKDKPEDLITQHMKQMYAYVRPWVGIFPRNRQGAFKKAKLTVAPDN